MNIISIEGLTLHYGDKLIFDDIKLNITKGDRVSMIAKNGSGKTTLMKILTGEESVQSAKKLEINPNVNIQYLSQDISYKAGMTIKDLIYSLNREQFEVIEKYDKALNENSPELEKYTEMMEEKSLWDIETRMKAILSRLEVDELDKQIDTLSGGQKKRVALAAMLLEEPDVILMDEPTNHLDPDMIEWLEKYLVKRDLTLFIITHDRYFLDAVSTKIFELDNGKLHTYNGNYAYYVEKKQAQIENDEAFNKKMKNIYRNEKEWMSRQPKARTTKAKSRIQNFQEIKKSANMLRKDEQVKLETVENRLGSKILEFHNVGFEYGDKVILDKFDYKYQKNDKIGICGKNGVGKSTFLKLITGEVKPTRGKIVHGDTLKIAHYRQENNQFDGDKKVIDTILEVSNSIPLKGGKSYTAVQMLERFLFPRSQHYLYVKKLSGGEKRRLSLIRILMQNPNFLILDEPTNDLDILTLNILQDFINDFEGCVMVVSHDRYFLDNVVDHLFVFEGEGAVKDFYGTYTEYKLKQKEQKQGNTQEQKKEVVQETIVAPTQKKLSYKYQRELDTIEKELPTLEAKQNELSAKLSADISNDEMMKISDELKDISQTIEEHNYRWLELMEMME